MERKLASVLFVDLVDSTALLAGADPEVVRQRVNRYFEQVARCIETHGGTVEKFAGEAVNLAARLQQAAAKGTILIGPGVLRLANGRVVAEPAEPVDVSGRREP